MEALSMRRLAQELGVEAMSLYNHVANKGEILDGIVDLAVSEIELPSTEEDWDAAIRKCAISAHEAFLRHPWACSLVMSPGSTEIGHSARLRYIEWLLRRLREAGFSAELTYHAYHALDSHVLGSHDVAARPFGRREEPRWWEGTLQSLQPASSASCGPRATRISPSTPSSTSRRRATKARGSSSSGST